MGSLNKTEFTQFVTQYERLVYTICFQFTRDAHTAQDLTQDTFLSAWLHMDACPKGYERQWLGRIAANKCKDHLQSAWSRRVDLPGDEGMPPGSPLPQKKQLWKSSRRGTQQPSSEPSRSPTGRCCGCAYWKNALRKKQHWPWDGQ